VRRALVLLALTLAAVLLLSRVSPLRRGVRITRVAAPGDPVIVIGDPRELRDGGTLGSSRFAATSAGLALYGEDGRHRLTLDRRVGLASHDLVAACVWGDRIVAAAADGSLLVAKDAFRVDATISDIASLGGAVLLATSDRGLLRWRGGPEAEILVADVEVTALAVSPVAAAAATAQGEIWILDDRGNRRLAGSGEDRVLALAWDGDGLLVGREDRIEGAGWSQSGGASALAASGGLIYAARPDGGVAIFRPGGGGERSTLSGVRIHRLRAIAGGVLAFGHGGAWRIGEDGEAERWLEAPPSRLASARVSALLAEPDALWVGGERGVDVLAGDETRHLSLPPVQALVASPPEVIAVTAGGRFRIDRALRPRPDRGPAHAAPTLVVATSGGLLWVGTREGLLGFRLLPPIGDPPKS